MRPLVLHGHSRALTMVCYNHEGDLLFTTSKDPFPTVWDAASGTRLGTYNGHRGAVWGCDVTRDSAQLATAGADCTVRVWCVETGEAAAVVPTAAPVRSVAWAHGGGMLAYVTDGAMGQTPALHVRKWPEDGDGSGGGGAAADSVHTQPEAIRSCVWGPSNNTLFYSSEDGSVAILDVETGKEVLYALPHDGFDARRVRFDDSEGYATLLSCGADKTAKLLDPRDLSTMRTYAHDFCVNDVVAVPGAAEHVLLGGGVSAVDAALVSSAQNRFEVRLCHKVHGTALGSMAGHFGPVNTLAAEPNGLGFTSGGEDGMIRVHQFDTDYHEQAAKGL